MPHRRAVLRWEMLAENNEWGREEPFHQLLAAQPSLALPPKQSSATRMHVMVAIALLATLVSGVYVWLQAQKGIDEIEAELQEMVEIEEWSQQTGHLATLHSLVDSAADLQWQKEYLLEQEVSNATLTSATPARQAVVARTYLRSELAMVQVIVVDEAEQAYRETRFYREEPGGWLRTSPSTVFWGGEKVLETEYFRILYRQADALAVANASELLDTVYTTLRNDLGLPEIHERMTIEMTPVPLSRLGFLQFEDNHLLVPSPLLMTVPAELSDETILVQMVRYPLVVRVWEEAWHAVDAQDGQDRQRLRWRHMLRGMQIWQAHTGTLLAATWYADTTTWLYHNGRAVRSGPSLPTPSDRQTLCREHAIWRYNIPLSLSPLGCTQLDWRVAVKLMPAAPVMPKERLDEFIDFSEWEEANHLASDNTDWVRSIAASTAIEYFVDTYGRAQLPLLFDGFRSHYDWEALIPAVLGISAQEFEDGWRDYLVVSRGIDLNVH